MYSIGRIGRCSARDGPLAKVFRPKTLLSDSVVLVTGRSGHQTEDPMHGMVSAPNCLSKRADCPGILCRHRARDRLLKVTSWSCSLLVLVPCRRPRRR